MNLAISGIGMITSVGRNAVQSCASIRAGISRPQEVNYFQGVDPYTQDCEPIIGYPIRAFSEGFLLVGLWLRFAKQCLVDLVDSGNLPSASNTYYWQKTAIIAVLPFIDSERTLSIGDEVPDMVLEPYLYPLHKWFAKPIFKKNLYPICNDSIGTIRAIRLADELISSLKVERVIVVAVDSHLDSLSLEWLDNLGRLKKADNPSGLVPGEAGACFMLESLDVNRGRKGEIQGVITGIGVDRELNNYESKKLNIGTGLSKAVFQAFKDRNVEYSFIGDLISDFNGEDWRANELAGAKVQIRGCVDDTCPVVFPATSIGDSGAVNCAIGICIAVRAFVRGYSSADEVLILSSTLCGQVGAALLRN